MSRSMWGWFQEPGAYVIVDGQFGSTGKGLLAAYIACCGVGRITHVTTNAGPNSGHTAFDGDFRVMTQQIPVASVFLHRLNYTPTTILNAGAIIDPDILNDEISKYDIPIQSLFVHPRAALITPQAKIEDQKTLDAIASTGKGIGPAMAHKISRLNRFSVAASRYVAVLPDGVPSWDNMWNWDKDRVFVETAQGFSLGLNSKFYPHVTSRECTVMQAISDARIPAQMVKKVACTFRTYPIRVGDTTGSSGDYYGDQEETTWQALGLAPELTTVTKRVRRVFTWSREQFRDCIQTNRPDTIFLNFCNYMKVLPLKTLTEAILKDYIEIMHRVPNQFLLGFGPKINDIIPLYSWLETV